MGNRENTNRELTVITRLYSLIWPRKSLYGAQRAMVKNEREKNVGEKIEFAAAADDDEFRDIVFLRHISNSTSESTYAMF